MSLYTQYEAEFEHYKAELVRNAAEIRTWDREQIRVLYRRLDSVRRGWVDARRREGMSLRDAVVAAWTWDNLDA